MRKVVCIECLVISVVLNKKTLPSGNILFELNFKENFPIEFSPKSDRHIEQ